MNPTAIIYPMGALALLTHLVLLGIPYRRFAAARQKLVTERDFRYGESANVPPDVSIPNRNLMNLLEMPLLFYVACLTLFVTHHVDAAAVGMAWAYVLLRVGHSAVHLTSNRVPHRLAFYALSNTVLLAIWVRLLLSL